MTSTDLLLVRLDGSENEETFLQLAEIHREAIHEGFLSTLGDRFLVTLYRSLSASASSFVVAATSGGQVAGFIAGAIDTGAVYREFARRAGPSAIVALAPKLLSPQRMKRVVETLLYPSKKQSDDLPEPEILNFCVRASAQGTGVGGRLFEELCAEFRRRDVTKIRIVTGESQVSAQRFYEKRGAILARTIEVHKGTPSRVYVFGLD
ncbi:MAG: GNAT family N-acetyltransferase [Fimbriimonadaceae bacterium]|nr:GNAT family N-acetyltransferase [Fimbriimonadaceae bacterium]QYK56092.1 MAG: GNAT family N-acetyltransferase [Fimbriimonadaceae bacterium]